MSSEQRWNKAGILSTAIQIAVVASLLLATAAYGGPAGTSASAETYALLLSSSSDRSDPVALADREVTGNIYAFTSPSTGVSRVRFYLDNPAMSGTPRKVENGAPHDFAGTTSNGAAIPFDTTTVSNGQHTITAAIDLTAGGTQVLNATFTVANGGPPPPPPPSSYELLLSASPDRSAPVQLAGATLTGNAYVFTSPDTGVSQVRFYLDNPTMSGSPRLTEKTAPYDFAGSNANGTAKPFDTTKVADGQHTITAAVDLAGGGTQVVSASFTVGQPSSLVFSPTSLPFSAQAGGAASSKDATLSAANGSAATYSATDNAPWLSVAPSSGTTPAVLTITANPAGLAPGTYNGSVTASAAGYGAATLPVTLTVVSDQGCGLISPLACSEVMVQAPYTLDFGSSASGVVDTNGAETGFRMIDPPTNGTGYDPDKLLVDFSASGTLEIATTSGLASGTTNSQDNALGVGVDAPDQVSLVTTTLLDVPAGTGKFEQAGLWFGIDEDNYAKLIVRSGTTGPVIQYLWEQGGVQKNSLVSAPLTGALDSIAFKLRADPVSRGITGSYAVNGGASVEIGRFVVPGEFFSSDAAGIDPTIGTRTFAGIFASHRNATSPLTYVFDDFAVEAESGGPPPGGGGSSAFAFDRSSFNLTRPSSMAFGPDGRLYVTEFLGTIHALTLDGNHQPTSDQVITTLGTRLTLGIAIDPASTPSNVILWVSHSDRNLTNDAPANSSVVSRLSGPGFTTRADVITGLPRSTANHSVNSLHFGPDGRLYIAISGNTGAGAPNSANSEFRDRPEQPLSAAILVADVKAAGFEGSCATPVGQFGVPATCDVTTHATGMRNSYDFTFHSNGSMYATDNGLGVTGSFPPSPTPPCTGLASTAPWNQGGHNPGEQDDLLYRVVAGKYYGHPNPYRGECVYKAGQYQGVGPVPNYQPPLVSLGRKTSSNGIIEYRGGAFGGALQGSLLVANYSQGDNIVRVRLSPDGQTVLGLESIVGGFSDPLPLVEGPDGTIYVGEFGAGRITALVPRTVGTWSTKQPLPVALLDAGGTAVGGKLYVVGGKTGSGPRKTLYIYDPAANSWTQGPDLPAAYPAVENPAVTSYNGKLYVFGGSTDAFSGAVPNAAVFDPATSAWTSLASMPTARGGLAAQAMLDRLYVVGGMDAAGASVATMEIYNPATNSWSAGAAMTTRRDNLGTAVLGGKLYVFGGRTRNADGVTVNGTLTSVEMFDPGVGSWVSRAPMPTGRRTMVVGTLSGRAQVMGGERAPDGGTFPQNEEYDPVTNSWRPLASMPTPRHGAAAGTINGFVYVVGGGPLSGTSFSAVNEAFSLDG